MEKEKDERRKQLADFLRSRRARLSPSDVNLPNGGRRRTPGLRREEVAQLAGVGVDWYTWLEQGRDINASEQVLSSVARVLRLDAAETRYLFTLVNSSQVFDAGESVSEALISMLDSLDTTPASILNRCWDFLAWNRAFCALYGDVASFPLQERNCLWFVFTSRLLRQMLVDWEEHMQDTVAQFRADYGSNASDPRYADLIRRLMDVSPEFSIWWSRHDVRDRYNKRKEFNHPQAGDLVMEQVTFQLSDQPNLQMVLLIPMPGTPSTERMRRLMQDMPDFSRQPTPARAPSAAGR